VVIGIGAGLCFPPTMTLAMTGVRPSDAGLASGLVNTTGQVGGAIGLSILTTVSTERSTLAAGVRQRRARRADRRLPRGVLDRGGA
jgi:hypothetical protein